jgi:hypothetical protein
LAVEGLLIGFGYEAETDLDARLVVAQEELGEELLRVLGA